VEPILGVIENRAGVCFENPWPRCAGRQCITNASGFASFTSGSLIQYGPNSASRRGDSNSVPIETQISV